MTKEIRIIIIEDSECDADLMIRELKKGNIAFKTIVVETKEGFEDALENFNADIILSDYSLPAFDAGTAFLIKEKNYQHIPFIIVSGVFGEENAVDLIKNGVTDYVPKDNLFTLIPKINRGLREADERRTKLITDEKLRTQTAELIFANIELGLQNKEKEKHAAELSKAIKELKKAEEFQEEYIRNLEEMMFMTSHKLRVPITNIMGMAEVLEQSLSAPEKLKKIVDYIKKSAIILDDFTKELAVTMEDTKSKFKITIEETVSK